MVKKMPPGREKNNTRGRVGGRITPILVSLLCIFSICAGVFAFDENVTVFRKAVRICLECIGIG